MQPAGGRADDLRQPRLHVHVDVLEVLAEDELAALDLALDPVEPALDRRLILGLEHADRREHGGVSLGAGDVLGGEALVEADRRVDRAHDLGGLGGKAAAP